MKQNKCLVFAQSFTFIPWFVNAFIAILFSWEQFWIYSFGTAYSGIVSIVQTMYVWGLLFSMLACPLMNVTSIVLSVFSAFKKKTYLWSVVLIVFSVLSFVLSLLAWGWFTVSMAKG